MIAEENASRDGPVNYLTEEVPDWYLEHFDEDTGDNIENLDPVKLKKGKDQEMKNFEMFNVM